MKQSLMEGLSALNLALTDTQIDTLCAFGRALIEKNKVMNLTAIEGEEGTARLHFLDCGALLRYADLSGREVLDVGSGAGFPGLVLKILCPGLWRGSISWRSCACRWCVPGVCSWP